jgi:hypothetical protein
MQALMAIHINSLPCQYGSFHTPSFQLNRDERLQILTLRLLDAT